MTRKLHIVARNEEQHRQSGPWSRRCATIIAARVGKTMLTPDRECAGSKVMSAIVKTQQDVIDFQTEATRTVAEIIRSMNSELPEEAPIAKFLEKINALISPLGISGYHFDLIRDPKKSNTEESALFEELTSYQNRLGRVLRLHTDRSFLDNPDLIRIPLNIWVEWFSGYFSFPKKRKILLPEDGIRQVVDFVMLQTNCLLAFLEQKKKAWEDPLTGLPNRRKVQSDIQKIVSLSSRKGHYMSFFLIDIDYFKKINDTYGHPVGDAVLIEIAKTLKWIVREEDALSRWGWEEFLIAATHASEEEGAVIASRILEAVRKIEVSVQGKSPVRPTCSIGYRTDKANIANIAMCIADADDALYDAKNDWRNQAKLFTGSDNEHTEKS